MFDFSQVNEKNPAGQSPARAQNLPPVTPKKAFSLEKPKQSQSPLSSKSVAGKPNNSPASLKSGSHSRSLSLSEASVKSGSSKASSKSGGPGKSGGSRISSAGGPDSPKPLNQNTANPAGLSPAKLARPTGPVKLAPVSPKKSGPKPKPENDSKVSSVKKYFG